MTHTFKYHKKKKSSMKKRGQVALEFLMTYGWALMIALLTISTLLYLGVFDLSTLTVERCDFSTSIYCIDGIAQTTGVAVDLQNGFAIDIENISVVISECSSSPALGPSSLLSGEKAVYNTSCSLFSEEIFESTIIFNYSNPESGFTHTKLGTIVYKVSR